MLPSATGFFQVKFNKQKEAAYIAMQQITYDTKLLIQVSVMVGLDYQLSYNSSI